MFFKNKNIVNTASAKTPRRRYLLFFVVLLPLLLLCPNSKAVAKNFTGLLVASTGHEIIEMRTSANLFFQPVTSGIIIPFGSTVRCRTQSGSETTELPNLIFPNQHVLLIFPGTIFRFDDKNIKLLLGRLTLISKSAKEVPGIWVNECFVGLNSGEILVQVSPMKEAVVALKKGEAWIKGIDRQIVYINPGREIPISWNNKIQQEREISHFWKILNPSKLVFSLPSQIPKKVYRDVEILQNNYETVESEITQENEILIQEKILNHLENLVTNTNTDIGTLTIPNEIEIDKDN